MEFILIVLALGLANWFATTLIVDSEFFRPLREWVARKNVNAVEAFSADTPFRTRVREVFWRKTMYLVGCHTCTGTWVGFAIAAFLPTSLVVPGIWPVAGLVLNALAIKAVGHLVLAWVNRSEAAAALDKADAKARAQEGQAALDAIREYVGDQREQDAFQRQRLNDMTRGKPIF